MLGGTVWIDYTPNHIPAILYGLGIEAEARDISINRSATQPSNFRLDTAGGGVKYTLHLRRLRDFQPYGKYLVDFGGIDWNNPDPKWQHETRTVMAPGGGFEYRTYRNIFVRADYEYQFWPDIALMSPGGHVLNPQGFTVGAVYDFSGFHPRN
jgi:opacity protein-like surface antigen